MSPAENLGRNLHYAFRLLRLRGGFHHCSQYECAVGLNSLCDVLFVKEA